MARLSSYSKDTSITSEDKLIGSNYGGLDNQGRPIFTTANYKISDLLTYFQNNISVDGVNLSGINTFQLNLANSLGTYSNNGTLSSLSSAFVNLFATAEAGNKFATSTFQTNMETSVLTFDGSGNATVSEAFANQIITTTTSDKFATSEYAQNIGSSFGTVASDGTVTLSEAFANSVMTTTSSNRFATSTYAQNLGSSIGTVDANGNITVSEAFANSVMNTETATNYASASSVTSLATTVSTKPDIFRQGGTDPGAPSTSNAVGSLWYDTDDNNKVYVLVAGDPNVWTLTDDSRIGSLVTSTASINQTLSTHTDDISANATFATGLASSFGTYDATTGEITSLSTSFANAVMNTENTTDYAAASDVTELNTQFVFTNGQITGTSGAISTEIASAQSSATNAAASKVEDLAANFFTGYDAADGSYTATSLSADFKTAVNAEVDANSSTADYVSNLSAAVGIDKTDGSTLQATAYINNGTAYTTTATVDGAVANSKEITITASNSNIEAGQYVTYSTQTSTTNRDVVFRVVSVSNITVVLDNDISLEDQTVLTFTGKSTYNIDNLSGTIVDGFQVKGSNITVGTYVVDYTAPVLTLSRAEVLVDDTFLQFLGVYAAVTETASVVANIDGSLQSTYGLQVDADGKIAGMKLFANNEGSEIAFTADSFKVYNGTTNYSPFKVENDTVYIKTVKFGDIENLPSYFVVTVVYADDASGTNASTTKGSKNYYGIFQGVNAWEDGDSVVGITFNQITGNAGTNGINAKVVKLTPSKHVINYNTDGTESDSITFTTEVQNITNSVTYRFDIVNNAGSVTTGTASATSTFTLNDADEPAEGERTTVKVYVFENGTQVATDSVTIYAVKDGSSAVTGFLTNASHTCSADNDGGNPVLTGSGGDFKVFVGGTDVSSSCTFSVVSYTSGLSIAIDSSSGAYTITGLTVDTANAVLKAVVPAATAGTAADVEITQTYSISKSIKGDTGLTGASGSNAKIIKLTPSKHVINYTESGSESDTIDFTTSVQNIEGTATYRFYINGTAQGTGATTTSTFTLPDANEPAAGSVTVVKVDVYDDLVLAASDSVSIYGVQDGSDAIVGFLTNAAHVVAASNNGTVSSFTGAGGTFNVFVGGTNVTTNCTFSVSSETGVDVSIGAATGIYTVNSMSADSGTAVFSAVIPAAVAKTVGNITITSNYSISKSIKGDTGDTGPAGTDSKSVIISASPQHVVLYDGDDNKTAVAIVLTATPVNLTSPQYRFLKDGVEKQAFSTTATYTIPDTEEPSSNTSNLWKVEAREGTGSTIAFDSLTVYGVKDGSDVYTAILSNESHVLPTTTAGTVTYTGSGTTIQVYKGNSLLNFTTDTPANNTFTISTSASNIARGTESGSGTDTYTVGDHSNMSATNASITYTITAYGLSQTGTVEAKATIVKKQSFAKSQQGATGAQGPQGPDGTDALRTVSGVLFWSVGQSTAPTKPIYSSGNPTGTEVVYTYSTGVFSGNGLDTNGGTVGVWQKASPQMAAGTAANDYWTVDYTILQADPSDTTATLSGGEIIFGTVTKSFAFNQVVTFSSLSTSGSTTINGDNITTGAIDSTNYQYTSGNFSTFGTKFDLSTGTITSKNFYINGGTGAAGFAGWTIDTDSIKSPAISSVHNLQLYSTASNGLLVRDSEGTTSVQIKYGGLSTLTPTTTSGITFVDVDNVEFGSFSGTITSGAVSPSSPESLYKTTGTTYLTGSNLAAGSYTYNITVAAITSALATITGTAKTTISLWIEFATDTAFANVIKSELLVSKNQTGAGTITFDETTKEISLSIGSTNSLYARFYWQRSYAITSGSSITYTARTFNISSANANNDLVFSKYKGRTEITNEGFQVINDPSTYFKIDREGYTSADPYVSIGGKLKVDGDVEVTGTINLSGEINNSDVTIDNLIERLGEINSNTYLGNSTGVTFTVRDNLIVEGNLTVSGTTVTVNTSNLSVADNLIHVADNNNLNTVDLGIVGHYSNDGGTTANHVGLFWDASATNWKFFGTYTKDELETTTVDTTHASFSLADVEASSFIGTNIYVDDRIISIGDSNTYMQFNAADTWRVVTGGSQKLLVNTNGVAVNNGTLTVSGNTTATSFIKSGGTSSEFLKADGTVDSNTYLTASSTATLTNKSGNISQWTNDSGYLTSYTEQDTLGAVTGRGNTTTDSITITNDTGLIIRTSTNGAGAKINFSDHASGSYAQNGTITYVHADGSSYGSGNAFIISGTESTTTILADGKLMYNEGIYSKPATGTGAGTRKDADWDAAYNWGNHAAIGYLLSADYTAADVLTKIKTVDGAASGLDADLLDGLQASAFMKTTAVATLDMANYNITNANTVQIADPGPNEGIEWLNGSLWKIYESPNDLTTNSGGNLQIVQNATRRATFNTSGQLEIPVATGTSPLAVSSTTVVTNLNADLLDGQHASAFALASHTHILGTDTTGNYVAGLSAGQGITVTGTAGEGWSPTVALQALDLTLFPTSNFKKSVKAATTGNITLSGTQTIDGIAVAVADRVLVKDLTNAAENGIYKVNSGAWTRTVSADGSNEIDNAIVAVDQGTDNGGQYFTNVFKTTDVVGTTVMPWFRIPIDSAAYNYSFGILGNAATATRFAGNGVNINGVAFNGTQNITITANTTATLTRGTYLTGSNFNGSAATTWAVDAATANTASKIVARDASGNFSAGTITAALSGNASTATAFSGTRTVTLTGDVTGSTTTWTGSGALSIATTIAANSVALGTDTTGNYVGDVTAGTGITIGGSAGEGTSRSIGLLAADLTLFPTSNFKKSVKAATTANITLSAPQTIDGISCVAGDRVLVKNQTTASQNGIYIVNASTWTRSTAADGSTEIDNAIIAVDQGTANGGFYFTNMFKTTDVVGTTSMPWYRVVHENGTWGISVSGNAATATILQNARTINGVSFNGSGNITITANTSQTLTRGSYLTGSNFNGGTATTWAVDATSTNTASKVVARDASGNFTAGIVSASLNGNASTATTLQTARTIALSGAATGTATSFNGSANITIPVTALNASNLSSGTIPDARLTGLYTGITMQTNGGNTHYTTPNSGSASTNDRTVFGLAQYKNDGSAATGAIVFYAPNTNSTIMHRLRIEGMIYAGGPTVACIVQGYRTTGAWSNTSKINLGITDVQVRLATDSAGKNCVILGDVGTVWSYPMMAITHAMFSHSGVTDAYCKDWTVGLVTSLTGFTNLTGTITNTAINTSISGNSATATALQTARTIGGVSFNGTANINLPGVNTAGNQSTSGNAATATILQTTRTINGTNFNGSANITTANWGTARTIWGQSINGSANITAPVLPAAGSVTAPAFSTSGDTNTGIYFSAADTVNVTTGGTLAATFSSGGDFTAVGNVTAYSDIRLKSNIQTLDGKKALQMRGVSYVKDGKPSSGVIAQEIEQIAPELVMTANDEMGTKSVAYGNLVGYLIEALKDQQKQIDDLKAIINGITR